MTVTLPYDPEWKALEWAKKHCTSYTTNTVLTTSVHAGDCYSIVYYFSDERDVTLFTLKWSR